MLVYDDLFKSILNQLDKEFHKDIINSSIVILDTPGIHTRFSNFATNMRELTREVFHTLAPDHEVMECQWYEKETNEGEADITRIQRMTYAIKGGLSNEFIQDELGIDFKDITKQLNKVIRTLNKYTHINEKVYYRDEKDGYEMVERTLSAFDNFLKTIKDIRSIILRKLEERLYNEVSDALMDDLIQEIDILATHYLIEDVWLGTVIVNKITASNIFIDIQGSVDIEHQYGSDGDYKRGDGIRIDSSYPFQVPLILDINYPLEISIEPYQIEVDNSSFYE
ncbi:hypothetical protein ACFFIS_01705 [Virgibacillus soli]|uniref:pPIWI-associating nuclease domain-containing protein n=1 Tax=Paracerasibacillus soli TaxID=480284 RepID=UPI0035ED3BDA